MNTCLSYTLFSLTDKNWLHFCLQIKKKKKGFLNLHFSLQSKAILFILYLFLATKGLEILIFFSFIYFNIILFKELSFTYIFFNFLFIG